MCRVGNVLTRRKGVGVFGSALLRHEGVRGFGFGIGCSGVIQMTRDGRRQVRVGQIGVGTVMVVTSPLFSPGSEVDFEPVVPVPKSRDNSRKSSLIIESMPPAGRWLVELWVGINPEGWHGCKGRIFIGNRW